MIALNELSPEEMFEKIKQHFLKNKEFEYDFVQLRKDLIGKPDEMRELCKQIDNITQEEQK